MRTYLMRIAFDGTDFHGFQTQPGLRTVQQVVEDALRHALRHPVELIGSGRTDSGVHAAAMGTSFSTDRSLPPDRLVSAITARLPQDVAVLDLTPVHPTFHARRDAECKFYQYRIHNSTTRPVANFIQRYALHWWRPLDVDRMNEAARYFTGTRDFSALAASGCQRQDRVRTILHCGVERFFDEVRINVIGNGFLYQQVRIMVGTLIEVGMGRRPPEAIEEIIASRDRRRAGPTARPHGLCLRWVRYPRERLTPPPDEGRSAVACDSRTASSDPPPSASMPSS